MKRDHVWYYRLSSERTYHSTGERNKATAELYVLSLLKEGRKREGEKVFLRDFSRDFFAQEGPWVRWRKEAGYTFSSAMTRMRTSNLRHYILPAFGDCRLHEIEPQAIRRWLLDLKSVATGQMLSGQSKNHILNTFSIVMQEAKQQKLISINPLDDTGRVANRYRRRDVFSLEELRRLFPRDRQELEKIWGEFFWAVLAFTALTGGLRSQEIRALQWRHVAWDLRGLILIQAVKADGSLGGLKSGEQRGVLLPGRALAFLRVWHRETPFPAGEQYVFYGEDGAKPLNKTTISDRFRKVLRRQGFDLAGRNLVFHSLRHTYNTRMRNVLSEVMLHYMIGHRSLAMTQRYDQSSPSDRLLEFFPERKKIGQVWI
jgi:integrase